MCVRRRAVAQQLRVRGRAAPLAAARLLEDQQRRALTHHEPVAVLVERPLGVRRVVVVTRRERPDDVERTERERRSAGSRSRRRSRRRSALHAGRRSPRRAPPRRRRTSWPSTGSGRARRARCRGSPAPPRRRPRGPGRRDLADPAFQVALVLLLGERDAPERRAEVDPDAFGDRARRPRPASAGVVERERPATIANWLKRSSWRAVFGGIHASGSKSSTWAATWLRNGEGSNRSIRFTGDDARRRPSRNAARPVPIGVTIPMPVIQMRRRPEVEVVMRKGSSIEVRRTWRRRRRR